MNANEIMSRINVPLVRNAALVGLVVWALILAVLVVRTLFLSPLTLTLTLEPIDAPANSMRLSWYRAVNAPEPEPEPEVVESEELREASINAELLGVVLAGDIAVASIATSRNPSGVFGIDDEIENNVIVEAIEYNRVIVTERGVRRQISLNPLGAPLASSGEAESLLQVEQTPQQNSGFALAGALGATPESVPGHGLAMRLDSVDSAFAEMSGLEQGDLVLSVGGNDIVELTSNPLLWQQLMTQTSVPLRVQRNGEVEELFVNAASLAARILPQMGQGQLQ